MGVWERLVLGNRTQEAAQRTRYLLGGGTEAERERLEAEFFADDDIFQEMLTAEDDLIDAYARGELSDSERRQFEGRFLNSVDGRERVQFARAFAAAPVPHAITSAPVVSTPAPGFLASIFNSALVRQVTFAAIAIVGFSWLLVDRSRMNTELNQLRAEREGLNQKAVELQQTADAERSRNAETLAQLKDLQDRLSAEGNRGSGQDTTSPVRRGPNKRNTKIDDGTFATNRGKDPVAEENAFFDVNPGSTRGGSGNTLKISRNARSITLRLGLENESSVEAYRATIQSANSLVVNTVDFKVTNVPHDRVQLPPISTTTLRPGDYVIDLMAKQPSGTFDRVGSYSFRVATRR